MMPCSCAASSASAIWRAIGSASSIGIAAHAGDPLREVLAVDQLHHERARRRLSTPVDLRDVRVIQRRQRARLALEARQPIRIGREQIGQHLDGDVALEPGVARAIHLAHSAGADRRDDLVDADAVTRGKAHGSWLMA